MHEGATFRIVCCRSAKAAALHSGIRLLGADKVNAQRAECTYSLKDNIGVGVDSDLPALNPSAYSSRLPECNGAAFGDLQQTAPKVAVSR